MKLSASRFVVRVWMPIMFVFGVYLLFHGMAPEYWLIALPLLLIAVFMSTLAEIRDDGDRMHIKMLWRSIAVPKEEVTSVAQALVEGVGVLRLRRFVFPWGRVYFVSDWSKFGVVSPGREEERSGVGAEPYSGARAILESLVVAISGLLAARAITSGTLNVGPSTFAVRSGALTLAIALCVVFAVARKKRPSLANVALFVATFVAGLAFR